MPRQGEPQQLAAVAREALEHRLVDPRLRPAVDSALRRPGAARSSTVARWPTACSHGSSGRAWSGLATLTAWCSTHYDLVNLKRHLRGIRVSARTERWRQAGLIVAGLGGFLLLWEFLVRWLRIKPYILPAPSAIPAEMAKRWPTVVSGTLYTGEAMLVGFGVAVVIGVALAVVVAFSRRLEALVYPVVLFLQIVPKIAVAPLFLIWIGYGLTPKVLLVFLLSFFPVLLNSIQAFKSVDPEIWTSPARPAPRHGGSSAWSSCRMRCR